MMDREVLLEVGCEEMPAAWLPALTAEIGTRFAARLAEFRLAIFGPVESHSTPRRLACWAERIAERQTDLEDTITGPPVTAGIGPDGAPTQAAIGFARRYGVEPADLARVETPKGLVLAYQRRIRGRAAVDVLPDVLAGTLRDLTFPKLMRWDAAIEDGRGELPFGRPIRWLLYLYGGRVVPFTIVRTGLAQSSSVQDVRTEGVTYGHRFLATSGRAGRAVKVRSIDEYRVRLAEHFVVLDRQERHDRIVSELDVHARRLGGRVQAGPQIARLLQEVPDLVEYPSIVAGTFAPEFLDLPPEVLTMTMVHHQHFFPVASGEGRILPAFLAVTNTAADNAKTVARNAERVLTARLRDARFFWQADRRTPLASKLDRLETVLFHQALGTYRDKAERLARLARWIAANQFLEPQAADAAATAGLLAKLDLTTDLVREFTDLQGTMGGIYAREDGQPESIWKAIYHHYLPVGVEPDAPPAPKDLGAAAIVWAAVSLADKIDTLTGLMLAGERPTGSRDPFGIRRQAHGLLRILVDLPELTGLPCAIAVRSLVEEASALLAPRVSADGVPVVLDFVAERLAFLFEQRGVRPDAVRAVLHPGRPIVPLEARRAVEALERARRSSGFETLAMLFKRVKNIAKELPDGEFAEAESRGTPLERVLTEPAERALLDELDRRASAIRAALDGGATLDGAFAEAAALAPAVDRFFIEILVMADDPALRQGRLRLLQRLRRAILDLADISELAPDTPGRVST